ncbi:CRP-like cAMP-binding protein [Chryseobacterium ginsenosidimutans]|uniref:Crp/Fnr family transcriptional regulator n=1 Tax=Chryseobacterium ginsenosidimutans TaxID=687846 RepID=UPI002786DD8F|nr:Crp/Fnr family transcriptional regulator [Chryseobacterium ginsenosidimutans]MDQ0593131.1 CRP-like cAMP-binding protein [Chryseobacterium ginsenosidimutans]
MIICENLLFSHGAEVHNYKSSEYIFREEGTPKHYLQIKSGKVKLSSFLEDGKEFIHGIPFDGHCFAETYLFHDRKYAVNAIAVTNCEIIKLEKQKLIELLLKKPELILNLYSYTAERMHYRYLTSASFSFKDPITKLNLIMNHLKTLFGFEDRFSFLIPYTRQQLASLTGMRIETVIRAIKKMEKQDIIKIDNSKIYI